MKTQSKLYKMIDNTIAIMVWCFFKEYKPGGREIILKHPGSLISQQLSNSRTVGGENVLLKKFSEVNISEKSPVRFWNK